MDETKPWPRAQRMPLVVAGQRAQPHHYQAIAEYDEARGEIGNRYPSVNTAAQVNEAITWWNKRAEMEAAANAASRPMGDERLAQLRRGNEPLGDHLSGLTADEVGELLAEVDRMRALAQPYPISLADNDISEEDRQRWKTAHAEMAGYAAPITFAEGENGNPQPQWPTP